MRIELRGHRGSVRYRGAVPGLGSDVYGVEWDEPFTEVSNSLACGDAGLFFSVCVPGTGALVPAPELEAALSQPVNLEQAIFDKYIADFEFEEIILPGNKVAEPVGLDKFHNRQKDLRNLRIVSLTESRIGYFEWSSDTQLLRNVWRLDLSGNLFDTFDGLTAFLQKLDVESLDLVGNRFVDFAGSVVPSVTELNLSNTMIKPDKLSRIAHLFPCLATLRLAENLLTTLPDFRTAGWSDIKHADMAHNQCSTLKDIFIPQSLGLSHNCIVALDYEVKCETLDLSFQPSPLSWSSIDFLDCCELMLLEKNADTSRRSFIIARIGRLAKLDGTAVTAAERLDAELYTMSLVAKGEHPKPRVERWAELVSRHGAPALPESHSNIQSRLTTLVVDGEPTRVLRTATVHRLAAMVARTRKVAAHKLILVYNGRQLDGSEVIGDIFDGSEHLTTNL